MKKNLKKLSSLALALLVVFSLSLSAFAADISAEGAKVIALNDAGYKVSEVSYLKAVLEYDDGVKYYDVSFYVKAADGSYLEYDYDVRVSDGKILEKDFDRENVKNNVPANNNASANNGSDVSLAQAKELALAYFGLNQSEVKFLKAAKDYDDGRAVYDVEFCVNYEVKYSCEVGVNGVVRDAEKEAARGFFDKLELFFEALFYNLFNR